MPRGMPVTGVPEKVKTFRAAGHRRAWRHHAGRDRGIQRQHLIFRELGEHQVPHLAQLCRIGLGNIAVLRPVMPDIVQLELVRAGRIGDRLAEQVPRRTDRHRAQHPAVVVQALHAHHLEILGAMR